MFVVDKSEDNMRLSHFIIKRLTSDYQFEKKHMQFSRGRAFYEFTKEEDLRFYRDVVYLTKAQVKEVRYLLRIILYYCIYHNNNYPESIDLLFTGLIADIRIWCSIIL